jgi:formylmethanofuran dehydrogenase subunit B
MSMVTPRQPKEGLKIVEDATCTFCGCLCDDITLEVEGNRIKEARNACTLGQTWFYEDRREPDAICLIDGAPAALEDGIDRAARILAGAKYPLVHGLCHTTTQAQRVAVSIADLIGGCVDTSSNAAYGASTLALQEIGEVTCTLGEVKNRGDLIIFWGCDPAESHPRHLSRYSLEPRGSFVPGGRTDRFCVVVDIRDTATAKLADEFLAITPRTEFEALWTLRALAKGVELDPAQIEAETGVPLSAWQGLVDRMKRARYGVIFFEPSSQSTVDAHQTCHAIFSLTRDMNTHARFVCVPLGSRGNAAGADNVLTWQTGYPWAVNMARGYPRFNPGEYTTAQILERGEADAALIIAGDPMTYLGDGARGHLGRIPTIVVDPLTTATTRGATVVFHTATPGIHTPGTVYRADGVPIPLRAAVTSPLPTDEEILRKIESRVRELKAGADLQRGPL